MSNNATATAYAVLLCHDSGLELSASNLTAVLKASNNKVPANYVETFVSALEGVDASKFLSLGGGGGSAPAQTTSAGGAPQKAEEKEAPKEEEEEDMDMGDLFG